MKTYKEMIAHEACHALSRGFAGEGSDPNPQAVRMLAEIYGWSQSKVYKDIVAQRDLPETYNRVYGGDRTV